MKLEFRSKHVEVFPYDSSTLSLVVFNNRLAKQLNAQLKSYPAGTVFKKGEEPIFRFTHNNDPKKIQDLKLILQTLKVAKSFLEEKLVAK